MQHTDALCGAPANDPLQTIKTMISNERMFFIDSPPASLITSVNLRRTEKKRTWAAST